MARCNPRSWGLLSCSFIFLCQGILCIDHVPVLIWSTDRSLQGLASTLHEGKVISKHGLQKFLPRSLSQPSRNVVLFLQDTLGVDDFTRYAYSSGNETPFRNVQESRYGTSLNVDELDVSQLMRNLSHPHIFVINLKPVMRINELSTRKALVENDKIIEKIFKALQQQGSQSVAIYTARQPSRAPVGSTLERHNTRQLMAVGNQKINATYPPLKISNETDTCILFYATNFTVTVNNTTPINLINRTFVSPDVNTSGSNCQNSSTAVLSLSYSNPGNNIKHLEIRFIMSNKFYGGSARRWFTLDHILILPDNGNTAKFNVSQISSPAEYSFHCQLVGTSSLYGVTLIPDPPEAKNWDIVISEFQIQAFSTGNDTFSYASDCTGFFSPAIWMALVSSLILLLILTYGIHMVVQLTTNSRFDDPQSVPLSVPQTE